MAQHRLTSFCVITSVLKTKQIDYLVGVKDNSIHMLWKQNSERDAISYFLHSYIPSNECSGNEIHSTYLYFWIIFIWHTYIWTQSNLLPSYINLIIVNIYSPYTCQCHQWKSQKMVSGREENFTQTRYTYSLRTIEMFAMKKSILARVPFSMISTGCTHIMINVYILS